MHEHVQIVWGGRGGGQSEGSTCLPTRIVQSSVQRVNQTNGGRQAGTIRANVHELQ